MSQEECGAKAVEAMGIKEDFIRAEIQGHGIVFGSTDNSSAVVFAKPVRGGMEIYVVVVGKDAATGRPHVIGFPAAPAGYDCPVLFDPLQVRQSEVLVPDGERRLPRRAGLGGIALAMPDLANPTIRIAHVKSVTPSTDIQIPAFSLTRVVWRIR